VLKRGTASVHTERMAADNVGDSISTSSESSQQQQQHSSASRECETADRHPVPVVADSEQIELEISTELARCCCPVSFPCERLDDCRYKVLAIVVLSFYLQL